MTRERTEEPEGRFGKNGAVMDAMSDEMRAKHERPSYGLDVRLSDAIPTLVGVAATPFLVGSDLAATLSASGGLLIVGAASLLGAFDRARVEGMRGPGWQEALRWSGADWRTRATQVALAASLPLGLASIFSDLFGR